MRRAASLRCGMLRSQPKPDRSQPGSGEYKLNTLWTFEIPLQMLRRASIRIALSESGQGPLRYLPAREMFDGRGAGSGGLSLTVPQENFPPGDRALQAGPAAAAEIAETRRAPIFPLVSDRPRQILSYRKSFAQERISTMKQSQCSSWHLGFSVGEINYPRLTVSRIHQKFLLPLTLVFCVETLQGVRRPGRTPLSKLHSKILGSLQHIRYSNPDRDPAATSVTRTRAPAGRREVRATPRCTCALCSVQKQCLLPALNLPPLPSDAAIAALGLMNLTRFWDYRCWALAGLRSGPRRAARTRHILERRNWLQGLSQGLGFNSVIFDGQR